MEVLPYNPKYIDFLLGDIDGAEIPEMEKRCAELIQCDNVRIPVYEATGSAE